MKITMLFNILYKSNLSSSNMRSLHFFQKILFFLFQAYRILGGVKLMLQIFSISNMAETANSKCLRLESVVGYRDNVNDVVFCGRGEPISNIIFFGGDVQVGIYCIQHDINLAKIYRHNFGT